jgi:molecular chaperone GrpE
VFGGDMSAKKKKENEEIKEEIRESQDSETIELDESELEEGMDLQKLADELGNEHKEKKKKKKGFFSKKDDSKDVQKLKDQLAEKDEQIKKLEQDLKAMVAENRNQKVRIENEFRSKIRFAMENFFRDFVTVKDDFDKAMEFVPTGEEADKDPFIQGVKHLLTKTENIMKSHGLEGFSSLGDEFDPNLHQAMSIIDVEGKDANEIVTEYMKGYKYKERILRPAMVVVASGNNPKQAEEPVQNEKAENEQPEDPELNEQDDNEVQNEE